MKDKSIETLLQRAVKSMGKARVKSTLNELLESTSDSGVLTIISNAGVHKIPQPFLRGEIYEASRGDWNVSSQQALTAELRKILSQLVEKLRSRRWSRIYLVPTGHPILSIQIKAMVYRILRLNTVDLYYKNGSYFEVDLDQRSIALTREGPP